MSIILSHTTAVEVLRQEACPQLLSAWDERTGYVPERLPTAAELRDIIAANPVLQQLEKPLHLLVSSDINSHSSSLITRHVTCRTYPSSAFARIGEDVYVASPELVPFQMARICTELEEILLLSELLGLYAIAPQVKDGMIQRSEPLTTKDELRSFIELMGGAHGVKAVRRALSLACSDSGSPMESKLGLRVRGGSGMGGYETEFVSMNEAVSLRPIGDDLDARQIRKPDIVFLLPQGQGADGPMPFRGVALEYKGAVHETPAAKVRDEIRRNELLSHGIKDYELTKSQYDDIRYMDALIQRIRSDLGLPSDYLAWGRYKRVELYRRLESIDCVHWGRG